MDGIAAPKKRKKGAVSELFISQTVYFVVVTIAVLCFKFFGGELYADFKSVAVKQLSDTTDINLVLDEVDKSDSLAASSKAAATKVSTDDAAFAEPYAALYDDAGKYFAAIADNGVGADEHAVGR